MLGCDSSLGGFKLLGKLSFFLCDNIYKVFIITRYSYINVKSHCQRTPEFGYSSLLAANYHDAPAIKEWSLFLYLCPVFNERYGTYLWYYILITCARLFIFYPNDRLPSCS